MWPLLQARGRLRELIGRGRGRGRGGRGLSTRLGPPGINGRGGFGARAVNYPQVCAYAQFLD